MFMSVTTGEKFSIMPELPEVETIKRELQKALKDKVISDVEIRWTKTISPSSATNFKKIIAGKNKELYNNLSQLTPPSNINFNLVKNEKIKQRESDKKEYLKKSDDLNFKSNFF